jgi:diguanylate cyclase (GGDEF)-like protein
MDDAESFVPERCSGVFVTSLASKPPAVLDDDGLAVLTRLAAAETPDRADALIEEARMRLGARMQVLAPLVETILLRVRENHNLRQAAGSDELTGIANRRAFNEALEREVARCERTGRGLAILLLDLDGLKDLNDNAGHAAGDEAIRLVASACTQAVRTSDLVARLGGDEFAVILPEMDAARAYGVAKRIRQQVEKLQVLNTQLRVSVGLAVASPGTTGPQLLADADAALYGDKRTRRFSRAPQAA